MKICLDPGHGWSYNRGAYTAYYESDKMFEFSGYLKAELEKYGHTVVVTKSALKQNPSLTDRGKFAMNQKADIVLSLHSNACNSESVNTMNVYGSVKTQQHDQLGILLANAIQELVSKDGVKIGNIGIYHKYNSSKTDYYGILRCSMLAGSTVKAAYILEHGFHTNTAMSKWLYDSEHLKKMAAVEAKVIAQYCAKDGGWYQAFDTNYVQYYVASGDSWSKIAKAKLGNATRYNEIQKYNGTGANYTLSPNFGLRIPKVKVDVNDTTVLAGKKLVTGTIGESTIPVLPDIKPGNKPETNPPTPTSPYTTYTVVKGDSWWKIAANKMGNGAKCTELAAFNGKKTTDALHPGDVLKIPAEGVKGYRVYTVKKGDSWWKIAANEMGSGAKYTTLAAYNGKKITDALHPGDILHIPTT